MYLKSLALLSFIFENTEKFSNFTIGLKNHRLLQHNILFGIWCLEIFSFKNVKNKTAAMISVLCFLLYDRMLRFFKQAYSFVRFLLLHTQ